MIGACFARSASCSHESGGHIAALGERGGRCKYSSTSAGRVMALSPSAAVYKAGRLITGIPNGLTAAFMIR